MPVVHIIGGGLAGSEAAWQAATLGAPVVLHEMRPLTPTAVHKTDRLAELVCSNSFRGDKLDNAVGLLKEEMRRLGSLVMREADRVRVPASRLVGALNGSFRQVMRQLEHERGGIDRLASNIALFHDSVQHADVADPLVRQEIAALESGYRVGRLLVLRGVLGQAPTSFSAATKTFCTELEQRVARFASSVAGADTLLWNRIARGACYAPAYTIMGGTTQVLRNIIGERILGLPR